MSGRLLWAAAVDGFRSVIRGRGLSVAAVLIIGLTFSISAVALTVAENLAAAVATWARGNELRVYLEEEVPPRDAAALAQKLRRRPEVESARLLSPEAVRRRFESAFPEMADAARLYSESPFPQEIDLVLVESAVPGADALADEIEAEPEVFAVLGDDLWADRLLRMAETVRRVGQGAGLFFALVAGLVVSGVVRLSLGARREEIRTMKVVGAPRWFVAGPFVVEGFLLSGLGGFMAVATAWAAHRFAAGLGDGGGMLALLLSVTALPPGPSLVLVGGAAVAGAVGALWAVRGSLLVS